MTEILPKTIERVLLAVAQTWSPLIVHVEVAIGSNSNCLSVKLFDPLVIKPPALKVLAN